MYHPNRKEDIVVGVSKQAAEENMWSWDKTYKVQTCDRCTRNTDDILTIERRPKYSEKTRTEGHFVQRTCHTGFCTISIGCTCEEPDKTKNNTAPAPTYHTMKVYRGVVVYFCAQQWLRHPVWRNGEKKSLVFSGNRTSVLQPVASLWLTGWTASIFTDFKFCDSVLHPSSCLETHLHILTPVVEITGGTYPQVPAWRCDQAAGSHVALRGVTKQRVGSTQDTGRRCSWGSGNRTRQVGGATVRTGRSSFFGRFYSPLYPSFPPPLLHPHPPSSNAAVRDQC
jgi:hypothetical protein